MSVCLRLWDEGYLVDTLIETGFGDLGMVVGRVPDAYGNKEKGSVFFSIANLNNPAGVGETIEQDKEKLLDREMYPVAFSFPANNVAALDVVLSNMLAMREQYYPDAEPFVKNPKAVCLPQNADEAKR